MFFNYLISAIPRFYSWLKTTIVFPGCSLMTLILGCFIAFLIISIFVYYGGDNSDD